MELNTYEMKLSYLKQIEKYNAYVLHLTSYKVDNGYLTKTEINTEDLDNSTRQVLGIYLIPRKKHRKTVLAMTPQGTLDLQKVYKKLSKVNGLIDITPCEGNEDNVKLYEELKEEYYEIDIEEFNAQKMGK